MKRYRPPKKHPDLKRWDYHPHDSTHILSHIVYFPTGTIKYIRYRYMRLYSKLGRRKANLYLIQLKELAKSYPVEIHRDEGWLVFRKKLHLSLNSFCLTPLRYLVKFQEIEFVLQNY